MNSNKKYYLYGLGNALVDIDFETTPETLQDLNIEKGVMTLIESDRYLTLLESLSGFKHVKACGGSAANTTMVLTQLGQKTFYSCKVANDPSGDFFYSELKRKEIGTNLTKNNREHGTTGSCLVLVTPDADRTMNTHLGISEYFSKKDLREEAIANSEYLYIEGYLSTSPTGSEAAIEAYKMAKKYGVKTVISLSDPNIVKFFRARLLEMIGDGIDLLFCNEDEAKVLCETDNLPDACKCIKQYAKTFAITQGPEGSMVFDGKELYDVGAQDVPVIDTVGAGDMFAGGFLHAIANGHDYKTAGVIADIVASKVISKFGPRLTDEEIVEVQKEIDEFLKG